MNSFNIKIILIVVFQRSFVNLFALAFRQLTCWRPLIHGLQLNSNGNAFRYFSVHVPQADAQQQKQRMYYKSWTIPIRDVRVYFVALLFSVFGLRFSGQSSDDFDKRIANQTKLCQLRVLIVICSKCTCSSRTRTGLKEHISVFSRVCVCVWVFVT